MNDLQIETIVANFKTSNKTFPSPTSTSLMSYLPFLKILRLSNLARTPRAQLLPSLGAVPNLQQRDKLVPLLSQQLLILSLHLRL